jgi:hypothetical protein
MEFHFPDAADVRENIAFAFRSGVDELLQGIGECQPSQRQGLIAAVEWLESHLATLDPAGVKQEDQ